MAKPNNPESGVAAVDRALSILEAFGDDGRPLTLAEIATRTGLYKSTILRLTESLTRFALLERGADGRFRIGPGAWRIGALFLRGLRLEERLTPIVTQLAEQTEESVSFYVPILNPPPPVRVCLLRADSPHAVRDNIRVGDRLPLDAGSGGRILRAFVAPAPGDAAVREAGIFSSWGERDPEVAGIAAPVFGPDDGVVGALTLSAPTSRRDRTWLESMKPLVHETARQATMALGGSAHQLQG